MKLHSVFISYNRLELTKQAIESYLATVTVPYTYIVVDNASSDGTKEWLNRWEHPYIALPRNRYPGFACNQGWGRGPEDATHLHRADNDFSFIEGWCEQVAHLFGAQKVGQVGLRTDEEEMHARWNVGGNCVIRRELWDAGLRYDERPWPDYPPGYSEDSFLSPEIERRGYTWTRVKEPAIRSLASGVGEYYDRSYGDRGIDPAGLEQQLGTK